MAASAVQLIAFTATRHTGGVRLQWLTGFEVDNLGFNLYRELGGKRTPITPELVAGSALKPGRGNVLGAGKSYTWWDPALPGKEPVKYCLEDVDLNGHSTWYGPIEVQQRRVP